jgi:hypothetical protein
MCAVRLLGEGVVTEDRSSGTHRSWGGLGQLVAAICVAIFVVLLLQGLYGFLVFRWLGEMDTRGQFGDIFGGVNALFTGLAFAGVIYTIFLQRKELELQREELGLTRNELHRSADAQSEQVARLEEAAELSAVSTLLSTYGTLLQPMRDSIQAHRVEIARLESELSMPDLHPTHAKEYEKELNQRKLAVEIEKKEWPHVIRKEEELVERLETLVGRRSQGNGAA